MQMRMSVMPTCAIPMPDARTDKEVIDVYVMKVSLAMENNVNL